MACPNNTCLLMCCLLVIGHFQVSQQLEIKNVKIPSTVKAGEEYVILDCDYSIDVNKSKGLVVKWYFNTFDLVYQWIYGTEPQAVYPVSRYIDLKYRASNNPYTMYRAMKLKQPDIDLTGNYTCLISTFQNEVTEKRPMTVYAIGQMEDFKLWHTTKNIPGNRDVDVTCQALGLFPKPSLSIVVEGAPDVLSPRPIITETEDGHYNIISYLTLENDNLPDSVMINCVLDIPDINYSVTKTVIYYPRGKITSTATGLTVGGSTWLLRKMDTQALETLQPDTSRGGGHSSAQMCMNSFGLVISLAISFIIYYNNMAN